MSALLRPAWAGPEVSSNVAAPASERADGSPAGRWGATNLTVRHGAHDAIHSVNCEVGAGEMLAIVGGDGAGKTTLLRALVGALPAADGSVARPDRADLGYVSASPGGYGDLTVDENLRFAALAYGIPASTREARISDLLERTDLGAVRTRLAEHLSGGMRRKLSLAMATMHRPRLLVLDEPSTGVDPVGRAELWRLLGGLQAIGTAVVLSTTYLEEAERAHRVVVLHDGAVLLAGTPDELIGGIPGAIAEARSRPDGMAWRRGASWRLWAPDGRVPVGAARSEPGVEDAVIVAQLRAGAQEAAR